MKSRFHFLLQAGLLLAIAACTPTTTQTPPATPPPLPAGSSIRGVFEGITPCSASTRLLPQISPDSDCELMTWTLVLYQDSATGVPTRYALESTYGPSQPNTVYPKGGGTPILMEGNWTISKGTKTDTNAEVYQLLSEDSQVAVSFVKMSENILHLLDKDQTLMVGNAAWSYTLNRTDPRAPVKAGPGSEPPLPTRPPIPTTPTDVSILGVFEGRLPCHEIVFDVLKVAPYQGCLKLKSRLILYQDQETGAPSAYVYIGTHTIREGTWTILQGMAGKPDAIVYQLHLDDAEQSAFFLRADANHLFLLDKDLSLLTGNALFSFTLSRSEKGAR